MLSVSLMAAASAALAVDTSHSSANLSAAQVAEKNVQARGGLQAWRAVQAISFEGKMGAGGNRQTPLPVSLPDAKMRKLPVPSRLSEEAQLPFKMMVRRPRQVRIELKFNGQTAVQVYDGAHGWKLRPFLNRRDAEPYTADELKAASMQPDLDGPLVDYAAKGTRIELDGVEKVEGRDTYKLKLTNKGGEQIHIWVDAKTFLETKIEGQPRRLDGKLHPVEVYYRDYRLVSGVQIPFVLETKVLPIAQTTARVKESPIPVEKISIDKVVVNPKIEASLFSRPDVQTAASLR
jgi:outer membrane lipoprotein-sorting protein